MPKKNTAKTAKTAIKTVTSRHAALVRQFVAASHNGDLLRQVDLAAPKAREIVLFRGSADDIIETVAQLVGSLPDPPNQMSEIDWTVYCDHVSAAYALGIAVSQLLQPAVFKTGGAR